MESSRKGVADGCSHKGGGYFVIGISNCGGSGSGIRAVGVGQVKQKRAKAGADTPQGFVVGKHDGHDHRQARGLAMLLACAQAGSFGKRQQACRDVPKVRLEQLVVPLVRRVILGRCRGCGAGGVSGAGEGLSGEVMRLARNRKSECLCRTGKTLLHVAPAGARSQVRQVLRGVEPR